MLCAVIKLVCSSAAKAELAALFLNTQEAIKMKQALEQMGHEQPPIPIITDNSIAASIVQQNIKKQKSRAMNMRYFWVIDQQNNKIIDVTWLPGNKNLADYVTKHHPGPHHEKVRPIYLLEINSPRYISHVPT